MTVENNRNPSSAPESSYTAHQQARRMALRAAMAVAGILGSGCGVSVEAMTPDNTHDAHVVADAAGEAGVEQDPCNACLPLLADDPNAGCNAAYLQCLAQLRASGTQCEFGCLAWGPFVPVAMEG